MESKLRNHLDNIFGPYSDLNIVKELKEDIYADLLEKMNDFVNQGNSLEIAYEKTINSIGNVSELIDEICENSRLIQMQVGMDFSKSPLKDSDFSKSKIIEAKYNYSDMRGTTFKDSILKRSIFKCSDMSDCIFDGADLSDAVFEKSDFRRASFANSKIEGTKFNWSDLSKVSFDGLKIIGANFDYAGLKYTSFKNTTLINVSFKSDVKKTDFTGAKMDKLTFAILKGYGADLKNVQILENM
jgi:uncharacterized protein YjbI with pentapeptide repeats